MYTEATNSRCLRGINGSVIAASSPTNDKGNQGFMRVVVGSRIHAARSKSPVHKWWIKRISLSRYSNAQFYFFNLIQNWFSKLATDFKTRGLVRNQFKSSIWVAKECKSPKSSDCLLGRSLLSGTVASLTCSPGKKEDGLRWTDGDAFRRPGHVKQVVMFELAGG